VSIHSPILKKNRSGKNFPYDKPVFDTECARFFARSE